MCVCALIGLAFPTSSQLARSGYNIDAKCPLCSSGVADIVVHRCWRREASEAERRCHAAPMLRAEGRRAKDLSLLFGRAIIASPESKLPRHVEEWVEVFSREEGEDEEPWEIHHAD